MRPVLSAAIVAAVAIIVCGTHSSPTSPFEAAGKDGLPRVVLIGDSIRLGYAPLVAEKLTGKAVIISPMENGGDSSNVLKNLDAWVIKAKPTLVHLNCGLH